MDNFAVTGCKMYQLNLIKIKWFFEGKQILIILNTYLCVYGKGMLQVDTDNKDFL